MIHDSFFSNVHHCQHLTPNQETITRIPGFSKEHTLKSLQTAVDALTEILESHREVYDTRLHELRERFVEEGIPVFTLVGRLTLAWSPSNEHFTISQNQTVLLTLSI